MHSKMTYYMLDGMLNPAYLLFHTQVFSLSSCFIYGLFNMLQMLLK